MPDAPAEVSPANVVHTNRLAQEKSPYLLQHARNPVDWYPWGEEAFGKARRENKPIFLSIGYSTCHWCHVMAHESFEDEETAAIMNREFVNIKVDREERPDVDRVYMTFVQATTGGGGWPMSVWLTPDLKPFVGGTYFPPTDRFGQPGFKKVLERIAAAWKQDHGKIADQGEKILQALRASQSQQPTNEIHDRVFDQAYDQFLRTFDEKEGGFGSAPKFPRPVALNFLTQFYARSPRGDSAKRALEMDLLTLRKMAVGGVHDHLGGGFHRYSVDRYWHVPHFEKMLYDQAQLVPPYLDAFQITKDQQYADIARDILDYVARDLTSSAGGFFSAEDADSLIEPEKPDHAEGAFYVWTEKQIDDSLGGDAAVFKFHFDVQAHGNASEGGDPQGEFRGENILIQRHSIAETAHHFKKDDEEVRKLLAQSCQKLLAIRNKRPRPHLDDKIIASWNGLMISAYARAAQVLEEPKYLEASLRAAQFLRQSLFDEESKVLFRSFREGRSNVEGFADDYAFSIQGLLDLYEASFDTRWLKFAIELQEIQDRLFFDRGNGGYFSTSGIDRNVVLRMKDDNDSAEPAASSIAAVNLLRLAAFRNDNEMAARARQTIQAFAPTLSHFASAMPQLLVALDRSSGKKVQIVIAGTIGDGKTRELLREVHRHFLPDKVLILADNHENQQWFGEKNEAIRAMSPVNGKPAVYVCENFVCKAPVTSPEALAGLLSAH